MFSWFLWFLWSRGPQDHKNTTRILVFSWSLGQVSNPGILLVLVVLVVSWSTRPQEGHKNVGLLVVSWLNLQPRHSFGSCGSRGVVVHKTTRIPQEFWSSRGLLVKSISNPGIILVLMVLVVSWSIRPQEGHKNVDLLIGFMVRKYTG